MTDNIAKIIDTIIRIAQEVQYQRMEGPQQLYDEALEDLDNAKSNLLKAIDDYASTKE